MGGERAVVRLSFNPIQPNSPHDRKRRNRPKHETPSAWRAVTASRFRLRTLIGPKRGGGGGRK